jgi:hypothetical protein
MSEQVNRDGGRLVPAGRSDLVPVAAPNPLVSRGMADLSKVGVQVKVPGRLLSRSKDAVRPPDGWYTPWHAVTRTPALVRVDPGMAYALWIELQRTPDFLIQLGELAGTLPLWSLEIRKTKCLVTPVSGMFSQLRSLRAYSHSVV